VFAGLFIVTLLGIQPDFSIQKGMAAHRSRNGIKISINIYFLK
jgi:hypothetical protein